MRTNNILVFNKRLLERNNRAHLSTFAITKVLKRARCAVRRKITPAKICSAIKNYLREEAAAEMNTRRLPAYVL